MQKGRKFKGKSLPTLKRANRYYNGPIGATTGQPAEKRANRVATVAPLAHRKSGAAALADIDFGTAALTRLDNDRQPTKIIPNPLRSTPFMHLFILTITSSEGACNIDTFNPSNHNTNSYCSTHQTTTTIHHSSSHKAFDPTTTRYPNMHSQSQPFRKFNHTFHSKVS